MAWRPGATRTAADACGALVVSLGVAAACCGCRRSSSSSSPTTGNLAAIIEFFRHPPEPGRMAVGVGDHGHRARSARRLAGRRRARPVRRAPRLDAAGGRAARRHGRRRRRRRPGTARPAPAGWRCWSSSSARSASSPPRASRARRHVPRPLVVGARRPGLAVDRLVGGVRARRAGPAGLLGVAVAGHRRDVGARHRPRRAGRPARRRRVSDGRRLGRRAARPARPRRRRTSSTGPMPSSGARWAPASSSSSSAAATTSPCRRPGRRRSARGARPGPRTSTPPCSSSAARTPRGASRHRQERSRWRATKPPAGRTTRSTSRRPPCQHRPVRALHPRRLDDVSPDDLYGAPRSAPPTARGSGSA